MRGETFDGILGCGFGMIIWAGIVAAGVNGGWDAGVDAFLGACLFLAAIWLFPIIFIPMGLCGWIFVFWMVAKWAFMACRFAVSKLN